MSLVSTLYTGTVVSNTSRIDPNNPADWDEKLACGHSAKSIDKTQMKALEEIKRKGRELGIFPRL